MLSKSVCLLISSLFLFTGSHKVDGQPTDEGTSSLKPHAENPHSTTEGVTEAHESDAAKRSTLEGLQKMSIDIPDATKTTTDNEKLSTNDAQLRHLDEDCSPRQAKHTEHKLPLEETNKIDICADNDDDLKAEVETIPSSFAEMHSTDTPLTRDARISAEGNRFYRAKNFQDALRCYDKVIKIESSIPKYFRNRGLCHTKLNNSALAREDFERAVKMDPDNIRGRFFFGRVSLEFKNYDVAMENLELARKFAEAMNVITEEKHLILTLLETACTKVLELDPSDMKAHFLLANALFEFEKYDRAIETLEKALRVAEIHDIPAKQKDDFADLLKRTHETIELEEAKRRALEARKASNRRNQGKSSATLDSVNQSALESEQILEQAGTVQTPQTESIVEDQTESGFADEYHEGLRRRKNLDVAAPEKVPQAQA